MIDFFNKTYTSITDNNPFLKKVRYYSLLRVITRVLSNLLLRLYFSISNIGNPPSIKPETKSKDRVIVSLTTFPARINNVWLVIESLMRQTVLPDKIILWLSKEQFDSADRLPKSLLNLQKRGLEVRFCDGDLRSHKKYFYALQEFPGDFIVTADDDIIYQTDLIELLTKLNKRYPTAICCHRAFRIGTEGNDFSPYVKWELLRSGAEPGFRLFQTSGGGTLFPPGTLPAECLNKEVFMEYCRFADDVWLNAMSQYNSVKIAKTGSYTECLPVINFNKVSLHSVNISQGYNDMQIAVCKETLYENHKKRHIR